MDFSEDRKIGNYYKLVFLRRKYDNVNLTIQCNSLYYLGGFSCIFFYVYGKKKEVQINLINVIFFI